MSSLPLGGEWLTESLPPLPVHNGILSRELHLDPAQITKEGTGSEILTGKNKDTAPGEGGTWKRTQEPGGKEALHE